MGVFDFIGPGQKAFDRELRRLMNPTAQARHDGIMKARQYFNEYLSPDAGVQQPPVGGGFSGMPAGGIGSQGMPTSAPSPMNSQIVEWSPDGVTDVSPQPQQPQLSRARHALTSMYADFFGDSGNAEKRKRSW